MWLWSSTSRPFSGARRAAHDLDAALASAGLSADPAEPEEAATAGPDEALRQGAAFLAQYQDQDYARQYSDFMAATREKIARRPTLAPGAGARFATVVAPGPVQTHGLQG